MSSKKENSIGLWRDNFSISRLAVPSENHSLHSYFNTSPESPDGKQVLFFLSPQTDALHGDLCLFDRENGGIRVLESAIEVAHRQANQQWVCGGKFIVYMVLESEKWKVIRLDPKSMKREVMCENRQTGWGQAGLESVPLYGLHWDPGEHRDLEMLNVRTGEITTILSAEDFIAQQRDFLIQFYGEEISDLSLFFPILSPDGKRLFFKPAVPVDRQFRSKNASRRVGMVIIRCEDGEILGVRNNWGHPSWHPDSIHIISKATFFNTDSMAETLVPNYPLTRIPHLF